jgi:hypothetical protein
MKKLIAYLLILATFNLVGCYTREQILMPSDYKFDENAELILSLKDTSFSIKKGDYKLKDDTLIYISSDHVKNHTLKKDVKLPTSKIEKLEVKKMDTTSSCLLSGVIVVVVVLIIGLFFIDDIIDLDFKLGGSL